VRSLDSTTVTNEVEFDYDARWRVTALWQDHDSAVARTGGNSLALPLQYAYDDAAVSGGNFARLDAITYPDGAWNHLVKVVVGSSTRSEYDYNGLNWRTVARADADGTYDGVVDRERVMIYDQSWRLLEERIDDGALDR